MLADRFQIRLILSNRVEAYPWDPADLCVPSSIKLKRIGWLSRPEDEAAASAHF